MIAQNTEKVRKKQIIMQKENEKVYRVIKKIKTKWLLRVPNFYHEIKDYKIWVKKVQFSSRIFN